MRSAVDRSRRVRFEWVPGVLCLQLLCGALPFAPIASAQGLPAIDVVSAPLVSPATASAAYGGSAVHTFDLVPSGQRPVEIRELAIGLGASLVVSSELTADAYAQRVFEYVRQNVDHAPGYGLQEGGVGAIIDQSGTSFDQAHLLVELLRQAGITATYRSGTITLNAQQFTAWTGLANARAACRRLADSGTPATVTTSLGTLDSACTLAGSTSVGSFSSVTLSHVWVAALGKLYDPAYKTLNSRSGIDLSSAMQCGTVAASTCGSSVQTEALTGASQGTLSGSKWIRNVNTPLIATRMQLLAGNLEAQLELPAHRDKPIEDVIGGYVLDLGSMTDPGASLPYSSSETAVWNEIPDQYRSRLRIQFDSIDRTVFVDEVAGRRLRLAGDFFSGNTSTPATVVRKVGLYFEFQLVSVSSRPDGTHLNDILTLTANHPYVANSGTYADNTIVQDVTLQQLLASGGGAIAGPVAIVHAWGASGRGRLQHYAQLQQAAMYVTAATDPSNPQHTLCKSYSGESPVVYAQGTTAPGSYFPFYPLTQCYRPEQDVHAAMWAVQESRALDIVAEINKVDAIRHHAIGTIATDMAFGGTSLNLESSRSLLSRTNVVADRQAAILSMLAFSTRLEGSVVEQTLDSWESYSGPSLFSLLNQKSVQFMELTASNYATANTQLQNYPAAVRSVLQANVASPNNFTFLVPRNWVPGTFTLAGGTVTVGGSGYYGRSSALDRVTFIVGLGYKGAGSTPSGGDPLKETLSSVTLSDAAAVSRKFASLSRGTGELKLTPRPDLVTGAGQFPGSLSFQRAYSSSQSVPTSTSFDSDPLGGSGEKYYTFGEGAVLGSGWKHNFQIEANLGSDPLQSMGQDSAIDAAQMIATAVVLRDLYRASYTNQRHLTAIFVADWWGDSLINNSLAVSLPTGAIAFSKRSDGSWNPPPNRAVRLTQAGARGPAQVNGPAVQYDYSAITFSLTDEPGSVMSFRLANQVWSTGGSVVGLGRRRFEPTSWVFPDGHRITFSYLIPPVGQGVGDPDYVGHCLQQVSNNLGRSLTFVHSIQAYQYGPNFCVITGVQDENGRSVQLDWRANQDTVTGADGAQVVYRFSTSQPDQSRARIGKPIHEWFAAGSSSVPFMAFEYDELYRARRMTYADGASTRLFVGGLSSERLRRSETVDPIGGRETEYFNEELQQVQMIDAIGRCSAKTYDARQRLTRVYAPDNFGPDCDFLLDAGSNPLGSRTEYLYDYRHNRTEERRKATLQSGLADLVITTTFMEGASVVTCAIPATCNSPFQLQDARGNTTTFGWNGVTGQLTSITSPNVTEGAAQVAPVTTFTYGGFPAAGATSVSLLTSKVERVRQNPSVQNLVTQYTYRPLAEKLVLETVVVDQGNLNLTTAFTFDSVGSVISINGPRADVQDVVNYQWDHERRLTSITQPRIDGVNNDASYARTRYCYDADGLLVGTHRARVSGVADPNAATAATTGRCASAYSNSQWQSESRSYFSTGDLQSITNAEGHVTSYGYDALGRTISVSEPVSATYSRVTRFVYDAASQKIEEYRGWNTSDQIRYGRWAYTQNGQVDYFEDPLQSVTAGARDLLNGNPSTPITSTRTDLVYDGHSRLRYTLFPRPTDGTHCTLPANPSSPNLPTCAGSTAADSQTFERYGYDANGNQTERRNRSGISVTTVYDALNRETVRTVPDNPSVPGDYSRTLTTTYDLLGRKLNLSADGQSIVTVYDTAGRVDSVTDTYGGNNYLVDHTYDAAGNRTGMTWPGDGSLTYRYDGLNRLDRITDSGGVQIVSYELDPLSQREFTSYGNGASSDSSYFPDGAVQSIVHSVPSRSLTYTYSRNHANQLASQTTTVVNSSPSWSDAVFMWRPDVATSVNYSPDRLNRYSSVGGAGYAYDLNGNLTSDGTWTFTYDEENRLRTASNGTVQSTYTYDPAGRRRAKAVTGGSFAGTTIYLSDGVEEIEERSGANLLLRRYAYGSAVDERVVMYDSAACAGGGRCFYQTNHQGSTVALTNQDGSVNQTYGYDPFGNPTGSVASIPLTGNPFRFTGRRLDPETRLYYYRSRFYSPETGRFLQTDPIGVTDHLNLYAYTGNDPVNNVDPTGLSSFNCEREPTCTVYRDVPRGRLVRSDSPAPNQANNQSSTSPIETKGRRTSRPSVSEDPDAVAALARIEEAAKRAMAEVTQGPAWLRGILVHVRFARYVRELGPGYFSEQSYIDGEPRRYGLFGTMRVDAGYGPVENPKFVVELKTGGARMDKSERAFYNQHAPKSASMVEISEVTLEQVSK